MALTPEQQKMLEELTALAQQPDADDFEVEIFSGDRGARVPYSKASAWLKKEFGIGDEAPAGDGKPGDGKGGDGKGGEGDGAKPTIRKLFNTGA